MTRHGPKLRARDVVGEALALRGGPLGSPRLETVSISGIAGPGLERVHNPRILQGHKMVNVDLGRRSHSHTVVGAHPRAGLDLACIADLDVFTISLQDELSNHRKRH